jgi:HSP20 family protein
MANVTRWDPFEDHLDDLFKGIFLRPMRVDQAQEAGTHTRRRQGRRQSYVVHAEIPGVKKEDIQVSIDGNQIAISAEVKRQKDEKQAEKTLRSERYYGKVYRAFSLGRTSTRNRRRRAMRMVCWSSRCPSGQRLPPAS